MPSPYRTFLALVLLAAGSLLHAAEVKLVPKALLGGRVSVMVPETFQPMSQELLLKKYSRPNPPSLVYANEAANVSIAFDHTPHKMPSANLSEGLQQMKAGMQQAVGGTAQFFHTEIRKINGREFAFLDVRTPSADGQVRNLIAATSLDERLLVIAFNCTEGLEKTWLATGNEIIQSIKIK